MGEAPLEIEAPLTATGSVVARAHESMVLGYKERVTRFSSVVTSGIQRDIAVERLRALANRRLTPKAPSHFEEWIAAVFPHLQLAEMAPRHRELWAWAEAIKQGVRPPPFVAIWPRGSGKSTTAELLTVYLGAIGTRGYVWYISGTQSLADLHVESIGALIESDTFGHFYPSMAERKIGKFGNVRGWRRNRMRCKNGFTIDALGLDVGARGSKVEERRPDLIIIDDIDEVSDGPNITDKKVATITNSILPAGSKDLAILAIQNLILNEGFFGRMVGGTADYLSDRVLSGPHPAIYDLEVEQRAGRFMITGGTPSWEGQNLEICQSQIDSWGYKAFCREAQHDIRDDGGLFDHVAFRHCTIDEVPPLLRTTVWVDPAVTNTDHSDRHGISVCGMAEDGQMYVLWSMEDRVTPEESLRTAVEKAIEYGSHTVGVEVDNGGDAWQSVYRVVLNNMHIPEEEAPAFISRRAGAGYGSKVDRASRLLVGYETGRITHVFGTHRVIEDGLRRFPIRKPFDGVDALVHCWIDFCESPSWAVA